MVDTKIIDLRVPQIKEIQRKIVVKQNCITDIKHANMQKIEIEQYDADTNETFQVTTWAHGEEQVKLLVTMLESSIKGLEKELKKYTQEVKDALGN